jgi:hypothetical protein
MTDKDSLSGVLGADIALPAERPQPSGPPALATVPGPPATWALRLVSVMCSIVGWVVMLGGLLIGFLMLVGFVHSPAPGGILLVVGQVVASIIAGALIVAIPNLIDVLLSIEENVRRLANRR